MRLTIGGVLGDALALFRHEADLLIRIAGPFVFLPAFAIELLVPPPPAIPAGGADQNARLAWLQSFEAWAGAQGGWYLLNFAVANFGLLVILHLLIDLKRPTLGAALRRTVGFGYLRYLLAMLLTGFVTGAGLILIIPGLLAAGRFILTGPALVNSERLTVPAAIGQSVRLTRGETLRAMVIVTPPLIGGWLMSEVLQSLEAFLREGAVNPVALAIVAALVALVTMAIGLATVLIQVAVWRRIGR